VCTREGSVGKERECPFVRPLVRGAMPPTARLDGSDVRLPA